MTSFLQTLKDSAFFSGLEEQLLNTLVHVGRLHKVEAGKKILLDAPDRIWIVKKGFLKWIMLNEEGCCASVILLRPGDVFGTPLQNGQFAGEVEAMTSCYLCNSRKLDFLKLAGSSPRLLSRFADSTLGISQRLGTRLANYMTRPAMARLAIVLGELAILDSDAPQGKPLRTPPITQRELSEMIGSTREMVTTLLKRLKNEGVIEGGRSGLSILLPDELEKLSAPKGA